MPDGFRMTTTVAGVLREFLEDPTAPQYGFELMRRCQLPSGSLYPILARLEKAGWIVGKTEAIAPTQEGRPPRRYYLLTSDGVVHATRELAVLSERLRPPARFSPTWTAPQGGLA